MGSKGYIQIHLAEQLSKSGLSKNKFCQRAELQRGQLNSYMRNKITRLDTDVLARMCCTLDCTISDLLEYCHPNNKNEECKK
ncbi:MAG: helix-turn-helix transcriptional regulator [Lachnospiraceae bacterium]|nr:helix-turn-helix transcriptional regulator [Lachnospiraceae bacterium]